MSVRTRKKRAHRKKRQPLSKAMLALVIVLVIFGAGGIAVAAAAAVWLQDLPDYKDSSAFNYAKRPAFMPTTALRCSLNSMSRIAIRSSFRK